MDTRTVTSRGPRRPDAGDRQEAAAAAVDQVAIIVAWYNLSMACLEVRRLLALSVGDRVDVIGRA